MKHRLSLFTLLAMTGVMLWCTAAFYPRYKQPAGNATLAWDAAGYYWYLPSIFIYDDLARQDWADGIIKKYEPGPADVSGFGFRAKNGHFVMKYPLGMALAEAPFFFIAHSLATPLGYPADGFSLPYGAAIQYGALLVAFLGLWLFRRLLLLYYSDLVVAVCLLILVVGSNYLNYSAIDGSITHNWLFTLYVALMLCTRRFYRRPSTGKAVAIGALCGLAALIRPTEMIACLIPLLWGLESVRPHALRIQWRFLSRHRRKMLLAVVAGSCFLMLQPIYWKLVSGEWLIYSYQDQGFSWLHPHLIDYAFSYRSGWLMYTPVMILALIGFVPFLARGPQRVMIAVFSVLAFYIVSAWDIWWYSGMGGRAMIQYYPALFFPMAALLTWLAERRWRLLAAAPVILLLMWINIWFTWHAHRGSLYDSGGGMSGAYYWRVIGRWTAPEETLKLRDGLFLYPGPTPAKAQLIFSNTLRGKRASGDDSMTVLDATYRNGPAFVAACLCEGRKWLRAEARFHCETKEWEHWRMTQFKLSISRDGAITDSTMVRVHRFLVDGETRTLSVDLKLPASAQDTDSVRVGFWNGNTDRRLYVEDLKVFAF